MSRLFLLAMFSIVLLAILRHCHCQIDCRDPPFSAEVFVDLPALQLMSIQHRDAIRTPQRCSQENGTITCEKQLCCEGEVGCCFRDPVSHRQACGCKRFGDSECTLPAPLTVLRSYVCQSDEMGQISMCLRKVRDGDSVEASISTSSGTVPNRYQLVSRRLKLVTPTLDNTLEMTGDTFHYILDKKRASWLQQFTEVQLEDNLDREVLDKLVDSVIEKRAKGLAYGRRTTHQN